jgi:DNA-directed RNA polymerase beta subunit
VVLDDAGFYDIIHRQHGQQLTESYGYIVNNTNIDNKRENSHIQQNEVLYTSSAFDEAMNYRYGKNAKVVHISCPQVTEDAIWINRKFADSLKYPMIHTVEVPYNTNELLINQYGDETVYKPFPDIGEETRLQVLCAKRRISNKSIVYSLRDSSLRNIHSMDDDVYYCDGMVMNIDIFCNKKVDEIQRNPVNAQIMYYYDEQQAFYKELRSILGKIINRHPTQVSDRLLHTYHRVEDLTSSKPIVNGNSKFENMILVFTLLSIENPFEGYKITGRFGEKGVIGSIKENEEMPRNQHGEYADIVLNPASPFGRLNLGQWTEEELTCLADNVVRDLKNHMIPMHLGMPKIIEFLYDVNPTQGKAMAEYQISLSPQDQLILYKDIMDNGLKIHQPPFWGNAGFEEFRKLYAKYRYARYRCTINGEPIIRRLIMGTKYVILLKQTPKSKYSARSLGMQGSLGHPSKSIKYKKHGLPYSDTPCRLGEQELLALSMMNDPDLIAKFLQIYANNQLIREKFISHIITTDNVLSIRFNPVITKSINSKTLNAYLKAGGSKII